VDDWRLRVCLERTVELAEVHLRLRDWPGRGGPLVHVPDPLSTDARLVEALAAALAPRYRVLSLELRGASAYQVDAADLLGMLDQFGFVAPVLLAEGLGCVAALLVAAWHAERVGGLVLVNPAYQPPASAGLAERALRDCPPDWARLRNAIQCPVLVVPPEVATVEAVADFLDQLVPVDT